MSYDLKIKNLELIIKDIDMKILSVTNSVDKDENLLRNLHETRINMMNELRRMRRLNHEESYERLNYDEDR